MPIFVIMKTMKDNTFQGEYCEEVVGTYAGAVKSGGIMKQIIEDVENWIIRYLKHLGSSGLAFKPVKSKDENVILAYDLLEPCGDSAEVFETIYAYPLRANLYEGVCSVQRGTSKSKTERELRQLLHNLAD